MTKDKILIFIILSSPLIYILIRGLVKVLLIELIRNQTPKEISTLLNLLNLAFLYWVIFGISLLILYYLSRIYYPLSRNENTLKNKIIKILNLIGLTFKPSLTTSEILEYKRGVCRDYAKLTAALLYNLYPNNRIFFLKYSRFLGGHVAAGIEINNKKYILDQKLPILGEQAWLNLWEVKEATLSELKKNGKGFYAEEKEHIKREITEKGITSQDLKGLLIEIEKNVRNGNSEIKYVLKNKARIYDISDDIIKESLLRFIKNYLQKEFVGNYSKIIKNIDITKKDDDLIIIIQLKEKTNIMV